MQVTASPNGSRPIRRRRTKADMEAIRDAIYAALAEDHPMTVRQVFYRLVTLGEIAKTEAEYKGTIVRLLGDMRRAGEIPFQWIADNTRWMRKPDSSSSLGDVLKRTAATYRRDLWESSDAYVEVWLEKEALAGVLVEETAVWDVPLMVTRGYPSLSFLHSAAQALDDRPAYLYYFGDRDPSGVDIPRIVEARIREIAPTADFTLDVVAVTPGQVEEWELPTRPTKKSDTRSKGFSGESVEVDAIPPRTLRELVREAVERHVDHRQLDVLRKTEEEERRLLEEIAANWGGS